MQNRRRMVRKKRKENIKNWIGMWDRRKKGKNNGTKIPKEGKKKVRFMESYKECQGCEDKECKNEGGLHVVEKGNSNPHGLGKLLKVGATRIIDEDWEELTVTVDSGAVDHVMNGRDGSQFETKSTEMSRRGGYYKAANDTKIYNEGAKQVKGYTTEGRMAEMNFQVCGVSGPLAAVRKMCKQGNQVVFDEDGSYIKDKGTGMVTKIQDEGEAHVMKLRVPRRGF